MKLRTWKYYISQGFRGVFKNGLMSAASIIIVSACVFTVILSLSIMVNVDYVLNPRLLCFFQSTLLGNVCNLCYIRHFFYFLLQDFYLSICRLIA